MWIVNAEDECQAVKKENARKLKLINVKNVEERIATKRK
jgi:hypothetical protein